MQRTVGQFAAVVRASKKPEPELREVLPGHFSACHLTNEL